jgi:hypothetical protein
VVLVGKGAMIFQWNGPAAFLHAMVDMWIFQKKYLFDFKKCGS